MPATARNLQQTPLRYLINQYTAILAALVSPLSRNNPSIIYSTSTSTPPSNLKPQTSHSHPQVQTRSPIPQTRNQELDIAAFRRVRRLTHNHHDKVHNPSAKRPSSDPTSRRMRRFWIFIYVKERKGEERVVVVDHAASTCTIKWVR